MLNKLQIEPQMEEFTCVCVDVCITRFFWPTFSLVESRSHKFSQTLKNKLTKIAQIAVNISVDVGFQDLIVLPVWVVSFCDAKPRDSS